MAERYSVSRQDSYSTFVRENLGSYFSAENRIFFIPDENGNTLPMGYEDVYLRFRVSEEKSGFSRESNGNLIEALTELGWENPAGFEP